HQQQRLRAAQRHVSGLRPRVPGGGRRPGGTVGYPLGTLFEEVAFVAYHFHWPLADILALEHGDRQRFIDQISAINKRMNEDYTPQWGGIPLELGGTNA